MIARINEIKTFLNIFHANVNANAILQQIIQIKIGKMINDYVNVKSIALEKEIIAVILVVVIIC